MPAHNTLLTTGADTGDAVLAELREIRALIDEAKRPVLSTGEAARYVGAQSVEAFYKWSRRVQYKGVSNGRHHRALLDEFLGRERRAFDRDFLRKLRKPRGRNARKQTAGGVEGAKTFGTGHVALRDTQKPKAPGAVTPEANKESTY